MENIKHKHKDGVIVVLENNELKIKSIELVEIINGFRKIESETRKSKFIELRHNDFMTKIKKELEVLKLLDLGGERNFSHGSYIDKQNQARPCFELNRDGMLQMLNSESTLVRYKTIEYINKLESQIKRQASTHQKPLSAMDQLRLQYQVLGEHEEKIIKIDNKIDNLENNMPLFNVECKELQALVKRKGVEILGGKGSPAYKNNSIRCKVYSDIQQQLRREFGVSRYEAIKRSQLNMAHEIVAKYKAPIYLTDEIYLLNQPLSDEDYAI